MGSSSFFDSLFQLRRHLLLIDFPLLHLKAEILVRHLIQSGDVQESFWEGSFNLELDSAFLLIDNNPNGGSISLHSLMDLDCFLETFA